VEKLNRKKILVVGGTGFIGSHLIKRCAELKWQVTSLSLKKKKSGKNIKNVRYIYTDFTNIKILKKKIIFDFDYIVNLGGYINHSESSPQSIKIIKKHYKSTINLIILSKKKIKRFIHIGTSDEYGYNKSPIAETAKENPISIYSLSKNLSSNLLLNLYKYYNFPVTILKFFIVYGPNQKKDRLIPYAISNSLKNKVINLSHGKQIRDFCYIEDAIDAIILCIKNKNSLGKIYNIGSGKPISVKKLIKKIIQITGKGKPKFSASAIRKKENLKLYPSIKKINKDLGWKPKVSMYDGLKKTVNYFKEKQKKI